MTPLEKYHHDLKHKEFSSDEAQETAVKHLQRLYDELCASEGSNNEGLINRLKTMFSGTTDQAIKGIYFWGGVGRGKTYLVDAFYECLPIENKNRIHFHRFMQMIHKEIKDLGEAQDPLVLIADKIAGQYRVICFDEFHVSDITDAMLLGGLLQALFDRGVVLVTTSNEHPEKLYWDGLQRERFLPAIELLMTRTEVVNVDGGIDYRLQYLDKAEIYHSPLDNQAEKVLLGSFLHIAPDEGRQNSSIEIENRKIQTLRQADGVVWFDFDAICEGPRGPADYIEIGRQFQTVLISNVPIMDNDRNDACKALYDTHR